MESRERRDNRETSESTRPPPQILFTLLRSWTLQEPQIERHEHQDNSDVHYRPLPEPVPEEQDIHADHDGYQREQIKQDSCLSSHPSFLLRAVSARYPSRVMHLILCQFGLSLRQLS